MTNEIDIREKRRQELGETGFSANQQGGALMQPRNGKELMDMANLMAASGQMVRDFYRGNPGDCAALIMICQPYGFNPFQVSWKTYKASKNADAPISYEGQLVNAMVNASAPVRGRLKYSYDGDGPTRRCTVTGIDRETGDEITYTTPELKNIPIKNSPLWKGDPDQQLGYYAARSWARRHFPELLLGVYTREEIEEAPMRDVTPKTGGFASKAKEARGGPVATESVEDAQVYPEVEDETQKAPGDAKQPETGLSVGDIDPSTEGAFGSEAFEEGAKAFQAGMKREMCPLDDRQYAADWLLGFDGAAKAAAE